MIALQQLDNLKQTNRIQIIQHTERTGWRQEYMHGEGKQNAGNHAEIADNPMLENGTEQQHRLSEYHTGAYLQKEKQ